MAKDARDDELEEAAEETKPKKKSKLLPVLAFAGGGVLLVAVSVLATLLLAGGNSATPPAPEQMDAAAPAGGTKASPAAGSAGADKAATPPIYFAFDPPFVVNFQAQDTVRFLQIGLDVMTRDQAIVTALEQHMPVIRNNLVMLFSSQDYTTISTRVGKERIRALALAEIQKVLKEQVGQPGVEEVYFTSFVMQ